MRALQTVSCVRLSFLAAFTPRNALFSHGSCLSLLGVYNKIPETEWLKQYTRISHSSGGREAQDQGARRFGFWWEPSSWLSHISVEKLIATYSSILSWKVPQTEEAGGLESTGSQELDMIERLNYHLHHVDETEVCLPRLEKTLILSWWLHLYDLI